MGGLLFSASAQSGWTKPKGEGFFKLSYLYFQSDEYHTLSGVERQTNKFNQQQVGMYGEYGLTDRLMVVMDWPMIKWQGFENTETVAGTGDLRLGLKYALSKKIPISISVVPELPIARANRYAQNDNPAFGDINLPTGDGEFNVYSTLAISTSLNPLPAYVNFFVTYNFRTKYEDTSLSDQLMEGFELGYNPFKKLWIKAGIKLQQSLTDSQADVSFVRGEGTEFASYYAGAFYGIKGGWGIDLTYINYMNAFQESRNIYQGPIASIGLIYELKPE